MMVIMRLRSGAKKLWKKAKSVGSDKNQKKQEHTVGEPELTNQPKSLVDEINHLLNLQNRFAAKPVWLAQWGHC